MDREDIKNLYQAWLKSQGEGKLGQLVESFTFCRERIDVHRGMYLEPEDVPAILNHDRDTCTRFIDDLEGQLATLLEG